MPRTKLAKLSEKPEVKALEEEVKNAAIDAEAPVLDEDLQAEREVIDKLPETFPVTAVEELKGISLPKVEPKPKVEVAVTAPEPVKEVEQTVVNKDPIRHWHKINGGTLYLTINGVTKMIKPNEKFYAKESELPKGYLNAIIPLDTVTTNYVEIVKVVKPVYKKVPSTQPGTFDIVGDNGKLVNEKSLTEDVANQFIRMLEA